MPLLTAPDSPLVFVRRLSSLVERRKRVVLGEEGRGRGGGGEAEGGARRRPDHERLRRAHAESPRGRPRPRVLVLAAPGRVGQGRAAVLGRGEAPADAAWDGNVRLGCGAASLRAATSVRRDLSGWRRRTLAREIPGARLLVLERAATAIPDAVAGEVAAAMLALQAHTVPAPTAGGRHRRAVRPCSEKAERKAWRAGPRSGSCGRWTPWRSTQPIACLRSAADTAWPYRWSASG